MKRKGANDGLHGQGQARGQEEEAEVAQGKAQGKEAEETRILKESAPAIPAPILSDGAISSCKVTLNDG